MIRVNVNCPYTMPPYRGKEVQRRKKGVEGTGAATEASGKCFDENVLINCNGAKISSSLKEC